MNSTYDCFDATEWLHFDHDPKLQQDALRTRDGLGDRSHRAADTDHNSPYLVVSQHDNEACVLAVAVLNGNEL